ALAGLDRVAAAGQRPGSLSFSATGPLSRELRIDTRLVAGPIDIGAQGTLRPATAEPAELGLEQTAGTIGGSTGQGEVAVALGKGRLEGRLAVTTNSDGLTARARVALSGADAGAVIAADGRAPVTGRLDLQAEVEGAGLSPAAFIGSLAGNGRITLDDAHLAS